MRIKNIEIRLLELLYILAAAILLLNIFKHGSIISMLFMLSIVLVYCLALLVWWRKFSHFDCICLLVLIFTFICVCINSFVSDLPLNFDFFKKYLLFCTAILFLRIADTIKIPASFDVFFQKLVIFLSLALVIIYVLYAEKLYVYTNFGARYLYFNFANPNFAALHFLTLALLNFVQVTKPKPWYLKCSHLSLACFMTFFCFETKSRNVQIIILLFLLIWIIVFFRKQTSYRISKYTSFGYAIWPILFCSAYMSLVYSPLISDVFEFLVDTGKGLDSRTDIWAIGFQTISAHPIFGRYDVTLKRQFHNTHLDLWGSYGIGTLVFVVFFLYKTIYREGKCYRKKYNYLYMIGFCCCIAMGMAEAALFAGSQTLFVLVGSFVLLSNLDDVEHDEVC